MKQARTSPVRTTRAAPVARGSRAPRWRWRMLVVAPLLAWGGAASWYAYDAVQTNARLEAQQAAQKRAYEDKVRALTRRLVGVASHQMLEQDGLAGRMADIVTRQVELENRLAVLSGYADRLSETSGLRAPDPARGRAEGGPPPAPDAGTLRIGGRPAGTPAAPGLGSRSALDGAVRDRMSALDTLTVREQFDALDDALDRVGRAQSGVLAAFARAAQDGIGRIRTVIASLGLAVGPPAAPRRPGPATGDAFEDGARVLQAGLDDLRQWRGTAEAVPVRRPLERVEGALTSNFGTRKDPFTGAATMHAGMDFRAPVGTSVRATGTGKVVTAEPTGGYGNLVEVDHGNGVVTRYAHLSAFAVSVGQAVAAGTAVGAVGSTGRSTGPHLHYETRINSVAVDPIRFLNAGADLLGEPPGRPVPETPTVAAAGDASDD